MTFFGLGVLLVAMLLLVAVIVAVFSSMKGSRVVTWVLGGLLLLVLAGGVAVLLMKPSALELEVVGPPGTEFVGEVTVDGARHEVRGTAPMTYYYPGRRIAYVVIPAREPDTTELEVRSNSARHKSFYGVSGELKRESALMFSEMIGGMSEPEWDAAAARLLPPETPPNASPASESSPASSSTQGE